MFDHKQSCSGPGTLWTPVNRRLIINKHHATVDNLFSDNQYHLYLKCGYARAFLQKDNSLSMWANMYDKMQNRRIGNSKRTEFEVLLKSFLEKGFNNDFPIPIDQTFQILDGSHRVAGAYARRINPVIEVYDNSSHQYGRSWFESVGFTQEEIGLIKKERKEIEASFSCQNLSVGVIWGCAFEFWEEIFTKLNNNRLVTAFWVELSDPIEMMNFVLKSYEGDGMSSERIINKSIRLSKMSTKVGIFALHDMHTEELRSLKEIIRVEIAPKMPDYFFDSIIHIIDCQTISTSLLSKYGGEIWRNAFSQEQRVIY